MSDNIEILIAGRLAPDAKKKIEAELKALNKKVQESKTSASKLTSEELKLQKQLNQVKVSDLKVEQEKITLQEKKIRLQQQELNLQKKIKDASKSTGKEGASKSIQAQADSMSKLKARYDAGKISAEQFLDYSNRIINSNKFQTKSIEQQAAAIRQREQVETQYRGAAEKTLQLSNKIIEQKKRETLATERLVEQSKKYAVNQQQLVSGQKGSLTNRLQGMAIGKDDVFKKFPELTAQYASLEKDIAKFGSTGSKTYKQLSNDMGAFNNNLRKSSASMKGNIKDGYSFLTMLTTGIKKMVVWSIAATAMYAPIRALQSGLQTLKELDSLMVDIAKVTNLTAREMENLVNRSFDAASALGQTAQSYLAAVAEFSRAGYEGQAEGLAELALLSQNVGELTSEQATEFLLATDAAYKYKGSQEGLMKVLDGMNEIDNKFATSIAKVAEGITVTGSIAANAGVGIDELSAALGTMTAATQRSGSEAGRAFRGIVMNLRQIRGETEDGDIIDEEALSKSSKALASVGIKIYELKGGIEELRNPMDILKDLAEQWDKISSFKQSAIIEAIGGKYRGNQLLSLIENFNMYQRQLSVYSEAAGSAMEENAKRMESWQAKLNQFTNAVGEMWAKTIDTDIIKFFIDLGTQIATLAGDYKLLIVLVETLFFAMMINGAQKAITTIKTLISANKGLIVSEQALTTAIHAKNAAATLGLSLLLAAATTAITMALEEKKTIEALQSEYDELSKSAKETTKELSKAWEEMTSNPGDLSLQENYLGLLEKQTEELRKQLELKQSMTKGNTFNVIDPDFESFKEQYSAAGGDVTRSGIGRGQYTAEFQAAWEEYQQTLVDSEVATQKQVKLGELMIATIRKAIGAKNEQAQSEAEAAEALSKFKDAVDGVNDSLDESVSAISSSVNGMSDLAGIFDEVAQNETIAADKMLDLISRYPEMAAQIIKINDVNTDRKEIIKTLFELEKQSTINGLKIKQRAIYDEIKAYMGLAKAKVLAGEISIGDVQKTFNAAFTNVKAISESIKAIEGLNIQDKIWGTTKSTTGSTKDPAKEAIKSAQDAQSTITSIIESEVDKRKKAIEDFYETELEAIQEVMDANDKRWAEEDYDKAVDNQMDSLKKLNDEKAKYTAAALSGDLTAQKKIRELDEDIAKEKEKLTDTQVDRQRTLQKDALNDRKAALEEEKKLELDKLDTVFDKSKVTATALQALFASNLDGFNSILSTYLKNLGVAESEIKRIIGGVTNTFGQASAGVAVAKKAGVSASEFPSYAEGGKSPMQVAMENSSYGQKIGAKGIENDLKTLLSLQNSWAGATDKQAVNDQANAIRKKYGITDPAGYIYPAWSYAGSYANGGQVSTTGMAMLHGSVAKPEYVLNSYQAGQAVMGNFQNTPLREVAKTTNNSGDINFGSLINIQGNVDRTVIPEIRKIANEVMGVLKWELNKSGQTRFA